MHAHARRIYMPRNEREDRREMREGAARTERTVNFTSDSGFKVG